MSDQVQVQVVEASQTTFAFRPDAAWVLRVPPGAIIRFETSPSPVPLAS